MDFCFSKNVSVSDKNQVLKMNCLIKYCAVFTILTMMVAACGSGNGISQQDTETGKVLPVVKCSSDTVITYALFVPSKYNPDKKWPLIIAFDPHAAGQLPVNLLSEEAEKYGFIVAGSNNSKNGMEFSESKAIYQKLLNDLTVRFSIDTSLIYTLGFSGGGRVAGSLAMTEGGIAGAISCGAGLSSNGQPVRHPFSFLGIAGTGDFNWTELASIDPQLEQAGFTHHFLDFDGKHEWPPKEIVPEMMDWIKFDAMRMGKMPTDRNAINHFIDFNDNLANSPSLAGKPYEQLKVYLKMKHYLQGLTDVTALDGIISQLEKDPKVMQKKKESEDQLTLEENLRQNYSGILRDPNPEFWKTESARLKSLADKFSPDDNSLVYKRILGFLSLSAYMYSNNALKQNDLDAAQKYVEIYRLVDPENSEHRYLAALIAARKQNNDDAMKALSAAIDLGFKDKTRLLAEPDFSDFHSDPGFKAIIKRL
jgi:hypothetical protein